MGKKRKTKRRQVETKPSGSQPDAKQNQQGSKADRKPSGGKYDVVFAVLPALIIVLAVLWDWAMCMLSDGWPRNEDINVFMYNGQRLMEGKLIGTEEFDDKFLIVQFLFYLPALLDSYNVWYLINMGGCLIGAYSVYAIMRDVFSEARGFSRNVGHYAGLYGGVFTLYLFSSISFDPHHINALPVCASLMAAVLTKRYVAQSGAEKKKWVLLLACFCASLAVGIRPYFIPFVGLIPLWIFISAQLSDSGNGGNNGKIDWFSTVRFAFVWNACLGLFFLCVNVLPYVVAGELDSFTATLEMLGQKVSPGGLEWSLGWMTMVYNWMELFSTVLFFSWVAFLVLFLTGLAGRFYNRAVALDLLTLTIIAPFSILGVTLMKHFWPHYPQFFLAFISIGAVSLFVLIYSKRYLRFLFHYKAIAIFLALLFVFPTVTGLRTKSWPDKMVPTVQNLSALLDRHGLEKSDFLAPYSQYVHVKFNQHRHGFPHVAITKHSTIDGFYRRVEVPAKFRIPRNSWEYCQMLDSQGPKLLVFFKYTTFHGMRTGSGHLAHCNLRHYDRYDLSDKARFPSDVAYYFIRRETI